jgi:hypothetical protein
VQVRGEPFVAWRAPRLRMPKRSVSRPKRPRSPPRRRGEDSSERGGEETPTDDEVAVERRTKLRHDPAFDIRQPREKPLNRLQDKRRARVVAISSEEEEEPLSPRGEEFDLQ